MRSLGRQGAGRQLPAFAFALALVLGGCTALERKPEPILIAGAGANNRLVPAAGYATDYAPGIRADGARLNLNLHVFGLSYHPDREGVRRSHLDNELNPGLGLNYEVDADARGVTGLEAGFFKDSGRNWVKFAGASYQFRLGEDWRLGGDLLAIHSPTYNHGRAFIAPIPRLTYDFGAVKLSAIYIPQLRPYVQFAVFGVYFTTSLGQW